MNIKHEIWLVVNKEGRYWKKNIGRKYYRRVDMVEGVYDPKTSKHIVIYPDKFTDILGRAKIFESKARARSSSSGHGLGDVHFEKYIVTKELKE